MPAVPATTKVVATDDEVNADGTRVGMVSGATYTVDDLFHGLVLMSGNDTAYALADAYGGRDKTIAEMNAKAGPAGRLGHRRGRPVRAGRARASGPAPTTSRCSAAR